MAWSLHLFIVLPPSCSNTLQLVHCKCDIVLNSCIGKLDHVVDAAELVISIQGLSGDIEHWRVEPEEVMDGGTCIVPLVLTVA